MLEIKSKEEFKSEINGSNIPVFVYFCRTYCGQCKMMERLVETSEKQFEGKIAFVKINIDDGDCLEIAEEFKFHALPTFILFNNANAVGMINGACSKSKLEELLNSIYTKS